MNRDDARNILLPLLILAVAVLAVLANAPGPIIRNVVETKAPMITYRTIAGDFTIKGKMYEHYHQQSYLVDTDKKDYDVKDIVVEVSYKDKSGKEVTKSFPASGTGEKFQAAVSAAQLDNAALPVAATIRFFGTFKIAGKGERVEFFPLEDK